MAGVKTVRRRIAAVFAPAVCLIVVGVLFLAYAVDMTLGFQGGFGTKHLGLPLTAFDVVTYASDAYFGTTVLKPQPIGLLVDWLCWSALLYGLYWAVWVRRHRKT